ncbi:MAG: hypothetical protein AB7F96_07955 [Beijerinckiaceae bacterium]
MTSESRMHRFIGVASKATLKGRIRYYLATWSYMRKAIVLAVVLGGGWLTYWSMNAIVRWAILPEVVRIAVLAGSPEESVFSQVAALESGDDDKTNIKVVPMTSYEDIAKELAAKKSALAIVRTDRSFPDNAESVAIMRELVVMTIASTATTHDDVADLAGKKVGVLASDTRNADLAQTVFRAIDETSPRFMQIPDATAAVRAIQTKTIEALMVVDTLNSKLMRQILKVTRRNPGVSFKFLANYDIDALHAENPAFGGKEVAKAAFSHNPPAPPESVKVPYVDIRIVARPDTDRGVVASVLADLYKYRVRVAKKAPSVNTLATVDSDYVTASLFPVHKGAIDYFRREQMNFYQRYSDIIWLALFYGGALGSLLLWSGRALIGDETAADKHLLRFLAGRVDAFKSARNDEQRRLILDQIYRSQIDAIESITRDEFNAPSAIVLLLLNNMVQNEKCALGHTRTQLTKDT